MAGDRWERCAEVRFCGALETLVRTMDFVFCAIGSYRKALSTERFAVFKGNLVALWKMSWIEEGWVRDDGGLTWGSNNINGKK